MEFGPCLVVGYDSLPLAGQAAVGFRPYAAVGCGSLLLAGQAAGEKEATGLAAVENASFVDTSCPPMVSWGFGRSKMLRLGVFSFVSKALCS